MHMSFLLLKCGDRKQNRTEPFPSHGEIKLRAFGLFLSTWLKLESSEKREPLSDFLQASLWNIFFIINWGDKALPKVGATTLAQVHGPGLCKNFWKKKNANRASHDEQVSEQDPPHGFRVKLLELLLCLTSYLGLPPKEGTFPVRCWNVLVKQPFLLQTVLVDVLPQD